MNPQRGSRIFRKSLRRSTDTVKRAHFGAGDAPFRGAHCGSDDPPACWDTLDSTVFWDALSIGWLESQLWMEWRNAKIVLVFSACDRDACD
jgi:hypothetical protein